MVFSKFRVVEEKFKDPEDKQQKLSNLKKRVIK